MASERSLHALAVFVVIFSLGVTAQVLPCVCEDKSLCAPLKTPPAKREVYTFTGTWAFGGVGYKYFDYDVVTTLGVSGPINHPDLICKAHSTGTRVTLLTSIDPKLLPDPTERANWIAKAVQSVKDNYADGLNLDFENPIPNDSPDKQHLTQWVQELRQAFDKEIPYAQLTFDVAWSPHCIDVRCYDFVGIAEHVDFIFAMFYDMQSQIFGDCIAKPNSPLPGVKQGMDAFLKLGIPANKIVLGVPWYGYRYPCVNPQNETVCPIKKVPFRGVNCSDAAGRQFSIANIRDWLKNNKTNGRQWDAEAQSPWFNLYDGDTTYQVRYDDIQSLSIKYDYANSIGTRGVGMWISEDLPLETDPAFSKLMWDAMKLPADRSTDLSAVSGQ